MELKGEFGHTAVTLDVFKEYVRDVLASKGSRVSDGFQEELEEVDRAVDRASPALFFPTTAAIAVKNRYSNIIPATSSRVVLCEVGADPSSSYINANCVSSPLGGPTFLATQAPLSHTAEDFWRMLWEKQSQIVVMLTKLREGDREKCFEYFPDTDVVKFSASGIQVVLTKKDVTSDVLVRSLILKRGKESREVFQLQYVGWPDFGIPTDFASFAHLFEVYRNLRSSLPLSKAVTIHCSAGVGRTGAFVVIDIVLEYIHDSLAKGIPSSKVTINIPALLFELRMLRPGLIQTKQQYSFVYEFINYCIESKLFGIVL